MRSLLVSKVRATIRVTPLIRVKARVGLPNWRKLEPRVLNDGRRFAA